MRQKPKPPSQADVERELKALGASEAALRIRKPDPRREAQIEAAYQKLLKFWKDHQRPPTQAEIGPCHNSLQTLVKRGRVLSVSGKYIPVTSKKK